MFAIPDYTITEQLYESAHSLIYRARRIADDLPVILKMLKKEYPSPDELARFNREYTLTQKLSGISGVINAYALEADDHNCMMVLEDIGGHALTRFVQAHPLPLDAFLRVAIGIADILGHVHHCQIIHKDISPANIVWNPDTGQIRIIDFGIATEFPLEQPTLKNPRMLEGTLAYMSPEQTGRMNRTMDYRTDLYSCGATLYHLLTGQLPFQAEDTMEMIAAHLSRMPAPPCDFPHPDPFHPSLAPSRNLREGWGGVKGGEVSKILSAIIMKLLAKNTEDRYQSAFGLKADLEYCLKLMENLSDTSQVPGTFQLGQQDVPDQFRFPAKLYGRAPEIQTLLQIFKQVTTTGQSSLLLVKGYAGIGKSAVVHEIHLPITVQRGYFSAGKFDQLKRNIPYFAIIQALQSFIHQILTEPEEQMRYWQEALLKAVAPNGQVIAKIIPEVELVIGPQPDVPALPPNQEQNRFNFVFQNFVRTCASPQHPLVLFLDDLQWADLSSLELLKLLLTDTRMNSLLIIGAYRDNEVNDAHPLSLKLKDLQNAGVPVTTITLNRLTLEHVQQIIADTLHVTPPSSSQQEQEMLPLAELCFHKTGGNPFFVRQFLQTLYTEGFLEFAPDRRIWQWNLANIRQADFTENIVDFMAGKIRQLPEMTRQVVTLAACIGNQFDLQTLALIHEHALVATLDHLREALRAELILPLNDTTFKFFHDRIQQAAYSLLNEADRPMLHLKIGRLLLANTPEPERAGHVFEILNQLNQGCVLLTTQTERDELAALNLIAGRRAKTSAAYQAALTYFQHGLELSDRASWQRQYDLLLALHVEAAEAAYLSGDLETMMRLVATVLANTKTPVDQVKAHEIMIEAYVAQNKPHEAVRYALPVLKRMGVALPEKPGKLHILFSIFSTRLAFAGKSFEQLSNLPAMTDPHQLAILRIMRRIVPAAQIVLPELFTLLLCQLARFSRRHRTPTSAYGYAAYGCVLAEFVGDFETAERFAQCALQILGRFSDQEFTARTVLTIQAFIRPWKVHLRETLSGLLDAYQRGLETGDLSFASVSALVYFFHTCFAGHDLAELERDMRTYGQIIGQLKQTTIHQYHEILRQTILNLRQVPEPASLSQTSAQSKDAAPWQLVGEAYNEADMIPQHEQMKERTALEFVYTQKMFLAYLFQAYPEAAEALVRLKPYTGLEVGVIRNFQTFYMALIRLARYSEANHAEQKQILRSVAASQKKLKRLAWYAPMNRLHQLYLVTAERARVLGNDADAIDYYDKAIACAKEHGYLHEEALAHELAARYYLSKGKNRIARSYLHDAHYAYLRWGANAKVAQLERAYPDLVGERAPMRSATEQGISSSLTETMTITALAGVVDLAALMKTSQLLSGEVRLEKLFEMLMRTILKNAGAEKGVFIEQIEHQFYIQAEGMGETMTNILQAQPVIHSDKIPAAIINYVIRSKQPLVLDNAAGEPDYATDPYIQRQQPKSVLCFPVLSKNAVRALLYLENNLLSGAFTPDRVETLTLLSSQVAISLENARLYATLEIKVKERTQALEQEVAERKQAQEAAQAAQRAAEQANQVKSSFVANMSHELRTPLSGILGYTQLFKQDPSFSDQQRFGIDVIHRSGEHLLWLIDEVLDFSKIEARKLELLPSTFAFPEFLSNVVEMARIPAVQKGLTLSADIASDLPAVVYADEQRLRQVLLNLLNNAIKFTESGNVTLRILNLGFEISDLKTAQHVSSNQRSQIKNLKFEISDTGIGIPQDKLEVIFQPFEQVRQAQVKKVGTGLGLAISQTIVRMMGSELHVKSILGQGSTFWFDVALPAVEVSGQDGERLKKAFPRPTPPPPEEPTETPQTPMIPPPRAELTQLYQWARVGDVISLQERLHTLSSSNPQYVPFERHLIHLARELKLDELENLLQDYLTNAV